MTGHTSSLRLEQLAATVGNRDRSILADLARVRVLSGAQLDALHFGTLPSPTVAGSVRRRTMGRLVELGVVAVLDRRTGGARAGSAGHVYALGVAGQRLLPLLGLAADVPRQARAPWTPGAQFLGHTLAVAGLYVALRVHERAGGVTVAEYVTEPACWYPSGHGGLLKPDAYALLKGQRYRDAWWIEVDRATVGLRTVAHKLRSYVDFARVGRRGPDKLTPRVLVTTPHPRRRDALARVVAGLQEPAPALFHVTLHPDAATDLVRILTTPQHPSPGTTTHVGSAHGGTAHPRKEGHL